MKVTFIKRKNKKCKIRLRNVFLINRPGCIGVINLPAISLGVGCNNKCLFLAHSACLYCGSSVVLPHFASNSSPRLTEQPLSWTLGGFVAEEKEMWQIIVNDTPYYVLHWQATWALLRSGGWMQSWNLHRKATSEMDKAYQVFFTYWTQYVTKQTQRYKKVHLM